MERFLDYIDLLNERVGRAVEWLTVILVLLVCYDVISRYLFQSTSIAIQEIEWHVFSVLFLLSAAYTLKHDRHVRVDLFYSNFSSLGKAWVNLLGTLFFLIPFCLITINASYQYVFNAYRIGEQSPDPGGLPARYLIKAVIPLALLLLLLQGIVLAGRSLSEILASRSTRSNEAP